MSYGQITEDLKTSVGELTNLMNETFTSCMKNYEALLPYLEKEETNPKIYNKLVHVNMLLNKLNEELVGLRVQYVVLPSYQQKRECLLLEGRRRKIMSDVSEVGRCEPKRMKMEIPFFNITKHSVKLFSETGINEQSRNFLATDTEERKQAQVQKSYVLCAKNVKSEIQDLDEVVVVPKVPRGNSGVHATQTLCDTINNVGSEENTSVGDKLIGGNKYDKPTDDISFPLQNDKSETRNQGKCEGSGIMVSKHQDIDGGLQEVVRCTTSSYEEKNLFNSLESPISFTRCETESAELVERTKNSYNIWKRKGPHSLVREKKYDVPFKKLDEECSEEINTYGIIRKVKQFQCTLCNSVLHNRSVLYDHLKGKKHNKKLITAKNSRCAKVYEVSNNSCTSTASVSVRSAVSCSHEDTVLSNSCESTAPISQCSADASSLTSTVPRNSAQSTSVSLCSDISCALADTVVIVEDRHQVISMKHAIRLEDVWTYFPASFHVNKRFFRIHSGQVVCSLCNEKVGRSLLDVKTHISRLSHLDRIKVCN